MAMASLQTDRHVILMSAQINQSNGPRTTGLFIGKQCTRPHRVPVKLRRETPVKPLLGYALESWISLNWKDNTWADVTDFCVQYAAGPAPDDHLNNIRFAILHEPQLNQAHRMENLYIRELLYRDQVPFYGALLIMALDQDDKVVPFVEEFIEPAKRAIVHMVDNHFMHTLSAPSSPEL